MVHIDMLPVNLGIIGLGHIGKYHIKALQEFKQLNLIAVCDKQTELSTFVPEEVEYYTDYKQLLNEEVIDTVIIATPNNTHYSLAYDALKAGKNLILEKPAAESIEEINDLEILASRNNLAIYYAFHAACAPDVKWFENYYMEPQVKKDLGPITGFALRFYDPYISSEGLSDEALGLGNCWLDSGINAISVIQKFIDIDKVSIENVSAAQNFYSDSPNILQCHVELSFSIYGQDKSGIGVIDTNWASQRNHKSSLLSFGVSQNQIKLDHSEQKVYRRFPAGKEQELTDISSGRDRLYNHYLGVFQNYVELGKKDNPNQKEAVKMHDLLFYLAQKINNKL